MYRLDPTWMVGYAWKRDELLAERGVTTLTDRFFVLSGFLITRVIVEARDDGSWSMPAFVANRFVRLFPALLVMVLAVSTLMCRAVLR